MAGFRASRATAGSGQAARQQVSGQAAQQQGRLLNGRARARRSPAGYRQAAQQRVQSKLPGTRFQGKLPNSRFQSRRLNGKSQGKLPNDMFPGQAAQQQVPEQALHQDKLLNGRFLGQIETSTDILLWLECYASMAALLATRYPNKAAELLAYQRTILCAHRDFEGEAWATYDTCYRRQAAAKKSLDWSQVDFNLYNQTFAGRARIKRRCRFCLSEYHRAADCYYAPDTPPAHSSRSWQEEGPRAPQRSSREFSPGYMYQSHTPRFQSQQVNQSIETCNLFNKPRGNMCRYKDCKFTHLCSNEWCYGLHPASKCTTKKPWVRKRPHSPLSTRFNPRQP